MHEIIHDSFLEIMISVLMFNPMMSYMM